MRRVRLDRFDHARQLFEVHRYAECLSALRFDPDHPEAWAGAPDALSLGAASLDRLGKVAAAGLAHERAAGVAPTRGAATAVSPAPAPPARLRSLVLAAICHARADETERAQRAVARAREIARTLPDGGEDPLLVCVVALAQSAAGDREGALELVERARAAAAAQPAANQRLVAWVASRQALIHRRWGDLARATLFAREAVQLATEWPGEPLLAASHRLLGAIEGAQMRLVVAAEHLSRALSLFRAIQCPVGEADTYRTLAAVYRRMGRLDESVALLEAARSRYRALDLETRQALVATEIGHAHFSRGEYTRALACYREDLGILERRPDQDRWRRARSNVLRRIARCIRHLAPAGGSSGRPARARRGAAAGDSVESALEALAQAKRLATAVSDPVSLAQAWIEEGLLLESTGSTAKARRCAGQARELLVGRTVPVVLATLERLEARLAADPAEACRLLASAVDRVTTSVPTLREVESRVELGKVLEAAGHSQAAIEQYRRAYEGALALDSRPFVRELLPRLVEAEPGEVVAACLDRPAPAAGPGPGTRVDSFCGLVGASDAMVELYGRIERVAHRDVPVLVTGETGTGKSLVARALHDASSRRSGRFLAINTGALSEALADSELFGHSTGAFTGAAGSRAGAFRAASGGTILLDEIGDLPPACQVKLLAVLEERQVRPVGEDLPVTVDVRVVCATHRNLEEMVAAGTFRQDLLERIRHYQIRIPPLRERAGDIPLLTRHMIQRLGGNVTVGPAAMELLVAYRWPGNVRELWTTLEAAAIDAGPGGTITPRHLERLGSPRGLPAGRGGGVPVRSGLAAPGEQVLPPAAVPPPPPGELSRGPGELTLRELIARRGNGGEGALEEITRHAIDIALEMAGGRVGVAASLLGVHRNTIARHRRR